MEGLHPRKLFSLAKQKSIQTFSKVKATSPIQGLIQAASAPAGSPARKLARPLVWMMHMAQDRKEYINQLAHNPTFYVSLAGMMSTGIVVSSSIPTAFYPVEKITEQIPADWRSISLITIALFTLMSSMVENEALKKENVSMNMTTNILHAVSKRRKTAIFFSQLLAMSPANFVEGAPALAVLNLGGLDMLLRYAAVHRIISCMYNGISNWYISRGEQKKVIEGAQRVGRLKDRVLQKTVFRYRKADS